MVDVATITTTSACTSEGFRTMTPPASPTCTAAARLLVWFVRPNNLNTQTLITTAVVKICRPARRLAHISTLAPAPVHPAPAPFPATVLPCSSTTSSCTSAYSTSSFSSTSSFLRMYWRRHNKPHHLRIRRDQKRSEEIRRDQKRSEEKREEKRGTR